MEKRITSAEKGTQFYEWIVKMKSKFSDVSSDSDKNAFVKISDTMAKK